MTADTSKYRLLHTMIRVKDLKKTIDFGVAGAKAPKEGREGVRRFDATRPREAGGQRGRRDGFGGGNDSGRGKSTFKANGSKHTAGKKKRR